jgi:hypothetical protein
MKLTSAIKKLEKAGFKVQNNGCQYWVENETNELSFCKNGGDSDQAICFNVRRKTDVSDMMTDYHAGAFYPNLSQAMRAF